jgi:hypothetical protein
MTVSVLDSKHLTQATTLPSLLNVQVSKCLHSWLKSLTKFASVKWYKTSYGGGFSICHPSQTSDVTLLTGILKNGYSWIS